MFWLLRVMKNFRDGQLLMRTTLAAIPLLRDALIFLCRFMLVASFPIDDIRRSQRAAARRACCGRPTVVGRPVKER